MLDQIKKLNPDIPFYTVDSPEFMEFGRVLDINVDEIISVAKTIPNPESGSCYVASEPKFEQLAIANEFRDKCFGELEIQTGYCWGSSHKLNALEWHKCSEVNVSVTPLVLLLAQMSDFRGGHIDSSRVKGFYVPEGKCIEVFATSMHFCPIQVQDGGFGSVVVLPKGTNVPLDRTYADKTLYRKNKWLVCCEDNDALKEKGVVAGISGTNFEIKY